MDFNGLSPCSHPCMTRVYPRQNENVISAIDTNPGVYLTQFVIMAKSMGSSARKS